ncbi:peptide ABC transporter substrate-binding protein [Cytobacillus praedii]
MKIKWILTLFIITFLLTSCNNGENSKDHLGEIYTIVLNSIMEKDPALSRDMEFIAIDMSNFEELNNEQKREILNFFKEKYKVITMDATFGELEEKGYYNPITMTLDGVLLRIEKVDFKFNHTILFEGSKFRSGKGAIGVECIVHYKDGEWQIKESKEIWIS